MFMRAVLSLRPIMISYEPEFMIASFFGDNIRSILRIHSLNPWHDTKYSNTGVHILLNHSHIFTAVTMPQAPVTHIPFLKYSKTNKTQTVIQEKIPIHKILKRGIIQCFGLDSMELCTSMTSSLQKM